MNKSPAFQFYPKDFIMDDKVAVMNLEQIGAYIKLLCYCWNNNGLPTDEEELKEMCGNPENWEKIWKKVGRCFYENNGKLYNKRLDKEREKQKFWKEKSKEGGIKSGKTRREKARTKGGSNKTKGGSRKHEPNTNHSVSSSPSSSSSSIPSSVSNKRVGSGAKKAPDPPHLRIKFNFKKKQWQGIIDEDLERCKKTFPDVDIEYHIFTKMVDWIITNPRKGRKKNYARFINNWLSDEQEKFDLKNAGKHRDEKRAEEWYKEED